MLACISIMDMYHDEIVVVTSHTGDKEKNKLSVIQKSENQLFFESGFCKDPNHSQLVSSDLEQTKSALKLVLAQSSLNQCLQAKWTENNPHIPQKQATRLTQPDVQNGQSHKLSLNNV